MGSTSNFRYYSLLILTWFFSALLLQFLIKKTKKSKTNVHHPPSPLALPVIGHLHLLGSVLSKSFQSLSDRYGPLMRLSIGPTTCVLVSGEAAAREMLKTNELIFVSRPDFGASDYNIYEGSEFVNADYGEYWRFLKKLCMTQLLAAPQISKFIDLRRGEVMKLLGAVGECAAAGRECNLGVELMTMTNNVICSMAMSTRCSTNAYESQKTWRLVKGILDISPKFSLGELLGPLHKLDLFGYGRKLKELMTEFDNLVERIMVEHEQKDGGEKERKDMMDIMLEISKDKNSEVRLTRKDIKSFLMEIFMAGTETISVALLWTIAELINHPEVYKKLREEIKSVVGPNRLLEESDVPNLPYLQAVVKEGLRLHAPAPLIFRKCMEDCKINGYDILKGSRIIFNVYAIMRDPNSWDRPTEFIPERFLSSTTEKHYLNQVDLKGRSFNYFPFGSGRRGCPGSSLASTVVHLAVGALVQCFDFKVKGGEKLDMTEGSGLSAGMATPPVCLPVTQFSPWENVALSQ